MTGTDPAAEFAGMTVIVSGGGSRLGGSMARLLHESGANVVIADLDGGAALALADELGERALGAGCDIRSDAAIGELVAAAAGQFGGIDGIVNSAVSYVDDGITSTREQWHAAFDVNLFGGACLVTAALPALERSACAAVVNVASIAAKVAQRGRALYPTAKAALLHLTRAQAVELAPRGIRVNSVSPAWTWSDPIAAATGGDRAHADRVGAPLHPLGRIGDAEEVAQAVCFLLSRRASFITGADLAVDGGHAILGPDAGIPRQGELHR